MLARLPALYIPRPPRQAGAILMGFVYWIAFLLILEPGNILRAHNAGNDLSIDHEAMRILAAACLGTSATPLTLWLGRRFFPHEAPRRPLALLLSLAGLSLILILVSCFLAAWMFGHRKLPAVTDFASALTGNGLLVLSALAVLCVIDHTVRRERRPAPPAFLRQVMVRTRGRRILVSLDEVERIESQGNYVALHAGGAVHLVRGTMTAFAVRLDPAQFVRVHRSAMVAVSRVAGVESFDNGDGVVLLDGGAEVRVSRNYRKSLLDRWQSQCAGE